MPEPSRLDMSASAADLHDVAKLAAHGIVRDAELVRRVRERSARVRQRLLRDRGVRDLADVQSGLRDPRLSSRRTDSIVSSQLPAGDRALADDYARLSRGMMLFQDGADHHRLRTLGNHAFTPSALDRFRPVVQAVVD